MRERRSSPRADTSVGEAARREAASLLLSGRPARVEAAERLRAATPQACGIGRGERRTPTDWVRTRRRRRSVPGVQRKERSTQPPDQCPTCEAITPTAGLSQGRRTRVNSVDSARAACEGPTSTPLQQHFPRGRPGGERIILRTDPCNRDHAPRFLWSETLEKAKQCGHYRRPETRNRGPAGPFPETAAKVFRIVY